MIRKLHVFAKSSLVSPKRAAGREIEFLFARKPADFSLSADALFASFASMRVDVCETLRERDAVANAIADPGVSLALKNFLAAIEGDSSLFSVEASSAIASDEAPTVFSCGADFVLRFRGEDLAPQRTLYFSLLEKMTALLKVAGSAEWLAASLCVTPDSCGGSAPALALRIRLEARGNSQEQASLRWCLGVAHVQQALLFMSRYLRQQIGSS